LITIAWLSFANVETTASLVRRTLATQRDLNAFGSSLADAETAQRGYLLTGIGEYLSPFESATKATPIRLQALHESVQREPAQLARINRLDTLSRAKLTELRTTLRLTQQGNRDSALNVVRTNVGDSLMRSIRIVLRDAIAGQDSLLTARESALESAFHRRNVISLSLGVILGLVLLWIGLMLKRLRRYRNLVTLCAWSKTVSYRGEWLSFEEYLRRRFDLSTTHGISPEALAGLENDIPRHT
jgi:CHASE3 domain sensor protein